MDWLWVVQYAKITESIQKRQNPVTNVNNMLRKLKSKIL